MSEIFYINENWLFTDAFFDGLLKKDCDTKNLKQVSLPHTVRETPLNYFDEQDYQLVSGYRKLIRIPDDWINKSVRLNFEGVAHEATVYINGIEKCLHKCGYTSFTVDISEDAIPGSELLITVKADSRESLNQPPFGYVMDYMTYGGIYRDVYIEVSNKTYIDNIHLYSDFKPTATLLCSRMRFANPGRKPVTVIQSVNGQEFKKEIPGNGGLESQVEEFRFEVKNFEKWSTKNPVLYTVTTKLYDSSMNLLDTKETVFGFRKSEFAPDGYYLNDEKVKIRGLNRHQSYPYVGYAMPMSMQRLDADIIKYELGLNAVRTSHYPQSHDFLNRCDEIGLLVFMEIPGWQHIGDETWKKQAVQNTIDMVREFRNHPSIILWGVRINESKDDDEFYKVTNEMAHKYDPSRPTGGVRALKKSHLFEDVYTYNDFVHDGSNKGCDRKADVTSDVTKPYLITEYNGHMYPTKAFDDEEQRREHAIRHANVLDAVAGEADIAGSFGWCMFDYNTHKDFGSGDRICYHGVMDMFRNPKMAALVYAAEGCSEPVLEISSSMDIGEHPGCNRGVTWIFTNADSVRMYKNDKLLKEYFPGDSPYKNLKHGPIKIDDFVGNAILEGENFTPSLAADVKEMMNYVAVNGMGHLPAHIVLLAAKAMIFNKLTMGDAVRLYNKYVGDWGGTSTVYKFEAVKDGKVVKTLIKEPAKEVNLRVIPSHTALHPGKAYDVALLRIEAVDQNGNVLPYFNEPVACEVSGDIEVIGPRAFSLKGGMGGIYVKGSKEGSGILKLYSVQTKTKEINFTIERDTKWNVLK